MKTEIVTIALFFQFAQGQYNPYYNQYQYPQQTQQQTSCAKEMESARLCFKELENVIGPNEPKPPANDIHDKLAVCFVNNTKCAEAVEIKKAEMEMQVKGRRVARECLEASIEDITSVSNNLPETEDSENAINGLFGTMQSEINECLKQQQMQQQYYNSYMQGPQMQQPAAAPPPPPSSAGNGEEQEPCDATPSEKECVRNEIQKFKQGQKPPSNNPKSFQQQPDYQTMQKIQTCSSMVSPQCRPTLPATILCVCESHAKFDAAVHGSQKFKDCLKQNGIEELEPPKNMCKEAAFHQQMHQHPHPPNGYPQK